MTNLPKSLAAAALALFGVLVTFGWALPAQADKLFYSQGGALRTLDTETGERTVVGPTERLPVAMAFLDRDRLLVLWHDGSLHIVDPEDATTREILSTDDDPARIRKASLAPAPGGYVYIFREREGRRPSIDLLNLETLETEISQALHLADRPGRLLQDSTGLRFLDGSLVTFGPLSESAQTGLFSVSPATGGVKLVAPHPGYSFVFDVGFAVDSQSRVWVHKYSGLISPPLSYIATIDPETGRSAGGGSFDLPSSTRAFAFRPPPDFGCRETASRKCFLGGRYAADVRFRDFEGSGGDAQIVPGGTDNTSLFWFFAEDNWELMVKVLAGCGFNDKTWVFLSATTNVEFSLTVTDLMTGEVRNYENPLGQEAMTVLDTEAFGCRG
ncbi:MAG: hypothetical protein AAF725_06420 [Acidobacteriota bacterium]